MNLATLKDTHRPKKRAVRVGRGPGSNRGKTCNRGHKGDKSRSGYKRRIGKEGGQLPLFQKLPCRGFPNGRFRKKVFAIDLSRIDALFKDGETVSRETLEKRGFSLRRVSGGIRILGSGTLTKKVTIEANAITKGAMEKLEKNSIEFKILGKSVKA